MAEEPSGTESAPVVDSPASGSAPESTPVAAPAAEQPSLSFAENLSRAVKPETAPPSAVDFDARLAEARQQWQAEADERYGWAKDYTPETVSQWRQAIEEAQQDPVETATRLLAASLASGNPQHRQKALSFAGRLLAGHTGQPAATQTAQPADAEPQADIPARGLNGEDIALYSAPQLKKWHEWNNRQLQAKWDEKLKPLEDDRQHTAQQRQETENQRQLIHFAQDIYTKASQKPGFMEHKAAITAMWEKMAGNDDPYQARENLHEAYAHVVFGKMQHSLSNATAHDSARRAAASTGRVVTAQPTQASPPAPLSFAEKLATEMAKRKGA